MANTTKVTVNSYKEIFKELSIRMKTKIDPHDLFEVGLDQIKRIDDKTINDKWDYLIKIVTDPKSKEVVYVRSHGKNGRGSDNLLIILKAVFGRDFSIDKTNNAAPSRLLKDSFIEDYQDYQISHIFEERTNNPLLFSAPWMICYTPKIIDPFTGHESKGFPCFREEFIDWSFKVNKKYIDKYNEIIRPYWKKLKEALDDRPINNLLQKHLIVSLAPINKDAEKLPNAKKNQFYLNEFTII